MIEHLATRGIFWLVAKRGLLELLYIFILHPSPCLVIRFELAKYIYICIYINIYIIYWLLKHVQMQNS